MTIQQFAEQLKQEDATPLLRNLQALRQCSLDQITSMAQGISGWIPWGAAEAQESEPRRLELQN